MTNTTQDVDPDDPLFKLTMWMYAGEPCRICGKNIDVPDLPYIVWTGYSKDQKARSAHGACWRMNKPQEEWAYPESEGEGETKDKPT